MYQQALTCKSANSSYHVSLHAYIKSKQFDEPIKSQNMHDILNTAVSIVHCMLQSGLFMITQIHNNYMYFLPGNDVLCTKVVYILP